MLEPANQVDHCARLFAGQVLVYKVRFYPERVVSGAVELIGNATGVQDLVTRARRRGGSSTATTVSSSAGCVECQ